MFLDAYSYTSQAGRGHNEDSVDFRVQDGGGIFAVADGLGGHRYGELASSAVIQAMMEGWERDAADSREWMEQTFEDANQAILHLQAEKGSMMKSTAVALRIDGETAYWAHTGDSRLYYIHDREIAHITADHSVAYKKYRAGQISRRAIAWDEDQSSLLRALGGQERYEPECCPEPVRLCAGDGFLLCTDGAWENFYDAEVLIDYLKAGTAKYWMELLLTRILSRMPETGNDNLSILAVLVE